MIENPDGRGIGPVPDHLRVLGTLDTGLLWGNLGVSLLVVVAATALVPALSLPDALVAIVLGCLIGNLMLAVAAAIGAQARVPAMVLLRAPLGERGSYLPTTVNLVQCIGWTVFELLVISLAAAALSDELFGFGAQWVWTLVFGALALVLGLLGPVGVVRRVVRTVGVWAVPLALAYLAWWGLDGDLGAAWHAPAEGGLSVWQGTDLVVAVTVSWIPLAADYTRFSRTPRSAFWGAGVGYLIPDVLLLSLGAVIVFTRGVTDAAELPAAVAAGGLAAFVALLALTVAETDEAFANAYSGAVSSQNLFPWLPQRGLVVVTTSLGVLGALTIELLSFQTFLFLLGSLFVPLFGVLLADWLVAGRRYVEADVFGAPPWRIGMVAVWILGFAVYQWLAPTGPDWWVDAVQRLDPPTWGVGATLPSFAVTLAAGIVVAAGSRRVGLRALRT